MQETHEEARAGQSKSDMELLELLMDALSKRLDLRLLRIGGPKGFRKAVITAAALDTASADPFVAALLSPNIPSIKILFADPHGEPFLKRLDQEGASSWKIWRVRKQLLQLVQSMLMIGARRQSPTSLVVGFHREELIWNLGIVGQDDTLVRPYGNGTGHDDSVIAHRIKSSKADILAGAFYRYFEALSTRPDTVWVCRDACDLEAPPRWPSLYKGNAILASENDKDGTAEPPLTESEICKICLDSRSNEVEERWLGLSEHLRRKQTSFRPGTVVRPIDDLRGRGIVAMRIPGPSLFELVACLDGVSGKEGSSHKGSAIRKMLLEDSLQALVEFRGLAEKVWPRSRRVTYPYATKLTSSLKEIRRHYPSIQEEIWVEGIGDARELGEELEQQAQVPFRDAHLKNRLWQEPLSAASITESLLALPSAEVANRIRAHLKDIDFETSFYDVTPWDDPIHILFFEYSSPRTQKILNEQNTEMWSAHDTDFGSMSDLRVWRTGLARSTREFSRRLWYRKVMPRTYVRRYSLESSDFFLRLAFECSSRCSGYLKLRRLLEALEAHCDFQSDRRDTRAPRLDTQGSSPGPDVALHAAGLPSVSGVLQAPQTHHAADRALRAFISYSHHDERHREKLERSLVLLQRAGLIETWNDRCLLPGDEWDKRIALELSEADIVILMVSFEFLASAYCQEVEVQSSLKRHEAGVAAVVPVVVRPVPLRHTPFSHIQALPRDGKAITTWEHEDEAWVDVEEGLRRLCLRFKDRNRRRTP